MNFRERLRMRVVYTISVSLSAIDFGQRGKVAHLSRFERVTVTFGGLTPTPQAERCDSNLPFASRSMTLSSMTAGAGRACVERRNPIFWP